MGKEEISALTSEPSSLYLFPLSRVLERSPQARSLVGSLTRTLVKRNFLLPEQYEKGLSGILKFAGDLLVDIPTLWDFVAQIVGK